MAIKCSLLGHDFGESSVEREREEQGSEVVITIREIETCSRCGEEKVVSENKEVTTLETPDDVSTDAGTDDTEPAPVDDEPDAVETVETEPEPDAPETPAEPEKPAEAPIEDAEPETTEPVESSEPPVTDDAEILDDDDDDTPEREPGEWPQEADEETSHDEEDFDQYGYMDEADESVDDEKTDAEFIDDDADAEPEQTAQTNAWPSEDEESVEASNGPGAVTVPEGEFVCEGCGFSTPVESSSLRAGDFCPECHQETLVQHRDS